MLVKESKNNFLAIVSAYIKKQKLLNLSGTYMVALSGGADSVALLYALFQLGYKVIAVHCNFHLRQEESDRDENFCKEFCKRIGVELYITHFNTNDYAKKNKVSIEMAARNLRYAYFEDLRIKLNANGICVGHHKNDNVETFLLNLIRGTGVNGLRGIKPQNGFILRPFLAVTRAEILNFLKINDISFVTDSSNLVDDVQRNQVRLNILPALRTINNAVDTHISKTIDYLEASAQLLSYALKPLLNDIVQESNCQLKIDIKKLLDTKNEAYLLWYLLNDKGFNSSQIAEMCVSFTKESGKLWESKTHYATHHAAYLVVEEKKKEEIQSLEIIEEGTYSIIENVTLKVEKETLSPYFELIKKSNYAFLDADKVSFPLTLRLIKRGDKFVPFGMKGSKLVSDFLSDSKVSLLERKRTLVLTDKSEAILWLVNHRISNLFCVNESTKNVLKIALLS